VARPSVITWRNSTRENINQEFADQHTYGPSLPPFKCNKYSNEKCQEFVFQVNMPLVSVKTEPTSKRTKLEDETQPAKYSNNDWSVLNDFDGDKVTILVEETEEIQLPLKDFFAAWIPGFAITVYAAQCCTMDWNFAIADSRCMNWRLLYTAVSRARSLSQVHLYKR